MLHLDLRSLRSLVEGEGAAFRFVNHLQPIGGVGDKVFPPTYQGGKYAEERRREASGETSAVLLDSVQSQANRHEVALRQARDAGRLSFPLVGVDFANSSVGDLGWVTTLEAPHRLADALIRDARTADGTRFRESELGRALATSSPRNATALFQICPHALLFGQWDSTGAAGGLGNKFARALVSEMVALDAVVGRRTSSRIDPAGIESGVRILEADDDAEIWTLDGTDMPAARKDDKGVPILLKGKGEKKAGKPSGINHGNVTPDIVSDDKTNSPLPGGVTFSSARLTTTLSLAALRRLTFPAPGKGPDAAADGAARTVLAALGLAAITLYREEGFWLRSRADLVTESASVQLLRAQGGSESIELTSKEACDLLAAAVGVLPAHLSWTIQDVKLIPEPKLVELIARSRASSGTGEEK